MKPYTLKAAQELVDDAIRRAKDRHDKWDALEKLYRYGQTTDPSKPLGAEVGKLAAASGLTVGGANLALPAVNIILESVVANPPAHLCEPLAGGPDAELNARVAEAVLRYFWKRTRGTQDLRDIAQDMVVLGSGVGKVTYAHDEHEEDRPEDEVVDELVKRMEADRLLANAGGVDPTPLPDLAEHIRLTSTVVDRDEPVFEYVSPYDIFVPLDARRLHEARWICHRLTLPLDEVQGNPHYKNTGSVKADATAASADQGATARDQQARRGHDGAELPPEGSEAFQTATVFEFYDMRTRRLLVFQMDADKPLYDAPFDWSHRHSPFVHARNYNDGGKEFWPFGELEAIAGLQALFNEFTREQIGNARRAGNKYVADQRINTAELREVLESDEPDVVAFVDLTLAEDRPINELVQALARAPLPADIYEARDTVHALFREVMGLNDFQTGGVGADRMSATAAAVVDGVATLRAQGKVRQIEEAASHVGNLMLLLCQEFMDEERAIRVSGSEGAVWPKVSAKDIHGEFLVSVEGGSTQAVNPATRQQRALDTLTTIGPALQAAGFDATNALRAAIRDFGMDPDHLMVRVDPEPHPQDGGAPPDLPAGIGAPPASLPTVPPPALGGPPVPAGLDGNIAL